MIGILAELGAHEQAIVAGIVLARLLLPLLIPRYPLVIVAALVLDAADNGILDLFTSVDLEDDGAYQSADKALDIYYLAIAYLAMRRNWTSDAAFRIGQFLFYYRLVGVLAFELADSRTLLVVFPNTFEYYFILYELVRLRHEPSTWSARFWLLSAAALWVLVKLPQEYWIHVAQRDFTDTVAENPIVGVAAATAVAGIAALFLLVVRPRLPEPDHVWHFGAEPLPRPTAASEVPPGRIVPSDVAEQVVLLALLSMLFGSILPGVTASTLELAVAAAVIVCANAAVTTAFTRQAHPGRRPVVTRLAALLVLNLGLVFLASRFLGERADFPLGEGLFFAFLFTVVVWLHDMFKPVYDARFADSQLRVTSPRDLWQRVAQSMP